MTMVIAVHVSKSRDLSQLYQLAAVTEPNLIEISNCLSSTEPFCISLQIFNPDRDPSALSIRFMQRAALQAKLAQGFDHNQDSPQNTGLSRYAYSHWSILIVVLAPLAVLSVPIIGVLLCCKSQSHPNNICAAIDEGPTSKQSERIGNWAPLKTVPATSSGSKPGCINLGKDTPLRGNISSNHGGDPPACGVPGASGGESPEPFAVRGPVPLPAEPDPLMYEVPASEGAEPTCVKSNERTQPTVLPDDETIQVAGAHEDTFPPLNLLSMETSALNRISCTQEACASSEMELICQLAKEEVMLISATDIQLLSEIGRGLLGSVHRALWHVPHKKPQEVTMIGLGTQKDRITLLQTAVTMGRLEHPNVVTTIGIMVEPERVCIVTEYCTNGSLLRLLVCSAKKGWHQECQWHPATSDICTTHCTWNDLPIRQGCHSPWPGC
eukprot:Em0138g4a